MREPLTTYRIDCPTCGGARTDMLRKTCLTCDGRGYLLGCLKADVDAERARLIESLQIVQRERDEAHGWRTSLTNELLAESEKLARLRQRVEQMQEAWRAKHHDMFGAHYNAIADALGQLLEEL